MVILSRYAVPLYATELLEGGSDRRGYLLKERVQHRRDVSRAVREVAQGRSVREDAGFDELTAREQEILALVAEGGSNAGIAEQLGITTWAVERHVHSIFCKLGLGDSEHSSRRVKPALLFLAGEVG